MGITFYSKTKYSSMPYSTLQDVRRAFIIAAIEYLSSQTPTIYDLDTRSFVPFKSVKNPYLRGMRDSIVKDLKMSIKGEMIDYNFIQNVQEHIGMFDLTGLCSFVNHSDSDGILSIGQSCDIFTTLIHLHSYLRKHLGRNVSVLPELVEVFQDALENKVPVWVS